MKRTPTLTFQYDPTVETGMRISQLLDEDDG
jgi:ribosome-binding factor A